MHSKYIQVEIYWPEYRWPTMEAAEIHSMSMEFLAWPWIDQFFLEDTEKYKFNHLAGAVSFFTLWCVSR